MYSRIRACQFWRDFRNLSCASEFKSFLKSRLKSSWRFLELNFRSRVSKFSEAKPKFAYLTLHQSSSSPPPSASTSCSNPAPKTSSKRVAVVWQKSSSRSGLEVAFTNCSCLLPLFKTNCFGWFRAAQLATAAASRID